MALVTFIIGNTMDWNCFLEFGHLECISWVNIVNFAFFPWIFMEGMVGWVGGSTTDFGIFSYEENSFPCYFLLFLSHS